MWTTKLSVRNKKKLRLTTCWSEPICHRLRTARTQMCFRITKEFLGLFRLRRAVRRGTPLETMKYRSLATLRTAILTRRCRQSGPALGSANTCKSFQWASKTSNSTANSQTRSIRITAIVFRALLQGSPMRATLHHPKATNIPNNYLTTATISALSAWKRSPSGCPSTTASTSA